MDAAMEEYLDSYFDLLTFIQDQMSNIFPGVSPVETWPEHKHAGTFAVIDEMQTLFEIANKIEERYGILLRDSELPQLFDASVDDLIEFVLAKLEVPHPI